MKEVVINKRIGNKLKQDSGIRALVDDDVYERISRMYTKHKNGITTEISISWSLDSNGYPRASVDRQQVMLHQLVIGKAPRDLVVNHIDRNILDNQRSNLEFVDKSANSRNRMSSVGSVSKYVCVKYVNNRPKKWRAAVRTSRGKRVSKSFTTELEAAYGADQLKRDYLPIELQYAMNFPREGER